VLAAAGVGSRRSCEELIEQGRVAVNGIKVNEQGRRVNPAIDLITVDGDPIAAAAGFIVIALNKPSGVVTTMKREDDRATVAVMLPIEVIVCFMLEDSMLILKV